MSTGDRDRGASAWAGRAMTDADLRVDANLFTIVRLCLASAVIFSHAFVLTSDPAAPAADPSLAVLPFPVSALAVRLFFALSGFLVTGSLVKRGVRDFIVARALRLLPGLWFMLVVTIVVLGTLFNAGTIGDLLASSSLRQFVARTALLIGKTYSIDGIFAANPHPFLVNGSLWTIPQEVRCYLVLAVLGGVGLLASRRVFTLLFAIAVVADQLVPPDAVAFLAEPRVLATAFFFGVALFLWRDQVHLSWPLAAIVVGLALAIPHGRLAETAIVFSATYAMLVVAMLAPPAWKRASAAIPDYSYGIYIYAFPAQQAAIALGLAATPVADMIGGFALTLPFAALSWHLVEKPALALKPRLTRARPALAVPAPMPTMAAPEAGERG